MSLTEQAWVDAVLTRSSPSTGLVDPKDVERIRSGGGPIDAAKDIIAIAALVERDLAVNSALIGAHLLDERVERAKTYLAMATPNGTTEMPNRAMRHALEVQSRVWTLVVRQHDQLWLHGAAIYLRDVDAQVPLLGSRHTSKRTEPAVETPAPVTG
jgi:hypothetical protein